MTTTTHECFQKAARIESLAQDLYAGLAETFAGRPYLRNLFARLAEEEAQHERRIWLLARHQGRSPWAAEAVSKACVELGSMIEAIESTKAEVTGPGANADPGMVLTRVIDMERRFGSVHAEQLARSGDPEVARLFSALALQDARHRALIEGAESAERQARSQR
jgi:rubrerythrin